MHRCVVLLIRPTAWSCDTRACLVLDTVNVVTNMSSPPKRVKQHGLHLSSNASGTRCLNWWNFGTIRHRASCDALVNSVYNNTSAWQAVALVRLPHQHSGLQMQSVMQTPTTIGQVAVRVQHCTDISTCVVPFSRCNAATVNLLVLQCSLRTRSHALSLSCKSRRHSDTVCKHRSP